jgi:hypothetical protein
MKTLTFAAGLAAGYILGTRAGRETYDQIVEGARNFSNQPAVTRAQTKAKDLVGHGAHATTSKISASNAGNSVDTRDVLADTPSPATTRPAPKKETQPAATGIDTTL